MKFRVVTVSPIDWPHAGIYLELAETLCLGFQAVGYKASRGIDFDPQAINVVLAAFNLTAGMLDKLPRRTVIYNLEQVEDAFFEKMPVLKAAFQRFEVWDYSQRNMERLRPIARRIHHLPIGAMPQMARIRSAMVQDIDVLFYGVVTDRRRAVLEAVSASGLNLKALFGVYGAERDRMIARSKVILNVHQNDAHVFEIARVSYLLTNRKAVVTELAADTDLPDALRTAVRGAPYEGLVDACRSLVADESVRQAQQEEGFRRMMALRQSDHIRTLLVERRQAMRSARD